MLSKYPRAKAGSEIEASGMESSAGRSGLGHLAGNSVTIRDRVGARYGAMVHVSFEMWKYSLLASWGFFLGRHWPKL